MQLQVATKFNGSAALICLLDRPYNTYYAAYNILNACHNGDINFDPYPQFQRVKCGKNANISIKTLTSTEKSLFHLTSTLCNFPPHTQTEVTWSQQLSSSESTRKLYAQIKALSARLHAYCSTGQGIRVRRIVSGSVSVGAKQGSIISPILLSVYFEALLILLCKSHVGCFIGSWFVEALADADDLALLVPSATAMRR